MIAQADLPPQPTVSITKFTLDEEMLPESMLKIDDDKIQSI